MAVPAYTLINALVEQHSDLVVLGFPCNQFLKQEPGSGVEILNEIRYVRPGNNFTSKMTQFFKKIDVNGIDQHPLYTYLKESCDPTFTTFPAKDNLFYDPLRLGDIAWNFEKFIIGKDGKPKLRYHPLFLDINQINKDLKKYSLAEPNPILEEEEAN